MEFYKLASNQNNGTVFERYMDNEIIKEMIDNIIFAVFPFEFKQQYIGEDTPKLQSFIFSSTTKVITSIRPFIYALGNQS